MPQTISSELGVDVAGAFLLGGLYTSTSHELILYVPDRTLVLYVVEVTDRYA